MSGDVVRGYSCLYVLVPVVLTSYFQLLYHVGDGFILSFHQAIGLWMVGCGTNFSDVHEFAKFAEEFAFKL